MDNANPRIRAKVETRVVTVTDKNDAVADEIDNREVFGEI